MPRLPILYAAHLDTLWAASLLCDICQERPWTTRGVWHDAVLCADCAADEPTWEDEAAAIVNEASRAEQAAADADADAAYARDGAAAETDIF
jgi:hypothetical protein